MPDWNQLMFCSQLTNNTEPITLFHYILVAVDRYIEDEEDVMFDHM